MSDAAEIVETYPSYAEARAALDRLLERDVPTSAVGLSARDIRMVERVHRKGWLYAAGDGSLSGALIGLVVGFFLGLFNLNAPGLSAFVLGFWGAVIGAIAGMATSLIVHAFRRDAGRHTTERSIQADRFDLLVHDQHLDRARSILSGAHAESAPPTEPVGTAA